MGRKILVMIIKAMCKKYPNDADLGKEIRNYINKL